MADFNIKGNVGDAFIRITKDKDVHLIFGEDNESLYREVSWEGHEVYKCAVQFSLMIDSYLRNAKALDDLIVTSVTGSIPAELIGKDLLPILLAGAGLEEFEEVEDEFEISTEPKETYKDNIIQFKPKDKNNEDK
jgi:hypothetical protein